jgi:hypothetical protein
MNVRFRAYASFPIGTERDSKGRVWCQLFPLGTWHRSDFPGGKMELTPELLGQFVANWKAEGAPALPCDYEHKEDGPASGWIEDLRIGADGCLEGALKWTDDAASDIRADKRRYLSPTWAMSHTNRRTGAKGGPWLYGAALTNTPFFDEMPRVAATATTVAETTQPTPHKEQDMSLARIAAILGLNANASEDVVVAATEEMKKSNASHLEESGKLKAGLVKGTEDTAKMAARNAELEADAKKHKEELFTRDFEAAFKAGLDEGRQGLPGLKDTLLATAKAVGLDAASKIIAGLPKLAMKPSGTGGEGDDGGDAVKQFEAHVAEKMKAGLKATDAYRAVAAEHPELNKKANSNLGTKPSA